MADRRQRTGWTRRQILAAAGGAASTAILAACGGSDKATEAPRPSGTSAPVATTGAASAVPAATTASGSTVAGAPASGGITLPTGAAKNPLNVQAAAPLDVVIFKGGFGDDYAINAEKLYQADFPRQSRPPGHPALQEQLQPRFVGGNPPDVIDNSGAGNLDNAALIADDQLAELSDLMSAPSFDTDGKTFKDTLLPGSQGDRPVRRQAVRAEPGLQRVRHLVQRRALQAEGLAVPHDLGHDHAVHPDQGRAWRRGPTRASIPTT